uniref:Uncharacterized protein n=1 Tax=Setaria viridis TaxID=4556 RepID=A0A4U6U2I9_SETVI|nr:hypothetical protein SEVIR_6G122054v2 [Setaria viridis]
MYHFTRCARWMTTLTMVAGTLAHQSRQAAVP